MHLEDISLGIKPKPKPTPTDEARVGGNSLGVKQYDQASPYVRGIVGGRYGEGQILGR